MKVNKGKRGKYCYLIFDGRAMNDIDDALCLFATNDFKEAMEWRKEYGECVVAKSKWDKHSPIILMPETYYCEKKGEK